MKPFVKIEDGILDNPKIMKLMLEAGYAGLGLYLAGITYCARNRTDGAIPKLAIAHRLYNPDVALIDALVSSGLWIEDGDNYIVHDYLENQTPRDVIERTLSKDAARKRTTRFVEKAEAVAAKPEVTIDDVKAMVVKNANACFVDGDVETSIKKYAQLYNVLLPGAVEKFAHVSGVAKGDALRNLIVHHAAAEYLGRELGKSDFTRLSSMRAKYGFDVIRFLPDATSRAKQDPWSYLEGILKKEAAKV